MNLVVVARQPEVGARAAETISRLTGRHPSRTLDRAGRRPGRAAVAGRQDPGPLRAAAGRCPGDLLELIFLTAGGETGRHLSALVAPLLIHDLPVTVWWPGEPPLGAVPTQTPPRQHGPARGRRVVWSGDGLARLRQLAASYDRFDRLSIRDFALVRQSRWREAIASIFDMPEFLPYLGSIRRMSVGYATHDETGAPGSTNLVKPLYHVAWLGSRLGMRVTAPLVPPSPGAGAAGPAAAGASGRRCTGGWPGG